MTPRGNQQWNRTYPGNIFDIGRGQFVVQTADGGYAATAWYQNKLLLLKTDQFGNPQWNQTYAGVGSCAAGAIVQSSDGGFALVGVSNFDPTYGTHDTVWLVKTDSVGNQQWNQTLGVGKADSLVQTTDGGYAITGEPESAQFMLLKTDTNGNLQLNETYGSSDEGSAYSIVQTSDGGYALGGWMWLRSNGGNPNIAIVKTNATGNEQWTQYYGVDTAGTITKTSDGGFAIAADILVKVDAAGSEQWGIGLLNQQAYSVIQTQDGGYAIAGQALLNGTTYASLTKINAATPNQTTQPSLSPSPTVPEFNTLATVSVMVIVVVISVIGAGQRRRCKQ